ncbi:catechol 2,3-dioxygenase-like lactoylglutathione lyase family enzyme [Caulobacter ginsengisoli]|uniref:Catechol 2,3-dioxygenase-like lactoylglutathione lyase family enzyme n=1 Tax=Caulobacter ginsengisoli TaxID=400775 RepID=A0ABU0IT06_9CAUL|nr:VOC family protein [Caulobacter ginsengisoli]MDQ0465146.1 catechol 2,3-dioxygenase-like lactoylglutathione lyase family enzyme [Caulobacter ginsengisoli]
MAEAAVGAMSPFFIVANVTRTIAYYRDALGFEATWQTSEEDPFGAVLNRGGAQLMVKSHDGLAPIPNPSRHPWMSWDAYVYTPDPDALAAEVADRGATFAAALTDREDGLRGFEIADPDGYVLFFGRPC